MTASGYSIDLVLECDGTRIGVEVDGPSHFIGRKPNGATQLKRRQLRNLGWTLLSVPYWEWDTLGSNRESQRTYLRTALATVQAATTGNPDQAHATTRGDGEASTAELHALTVPQLKQRLRDEGLPVSGRKADLIERLSASGRHIRTS